MGNNLYKFEGYLVCLDGRMRPRTAAMDTFCCGSGGNVVRRMGTQQHLVCLYFPNYFNI